MAVAMTTTIGQHSGHSKIAEHGDAAHHCDDLKNEARRHKTNDCNTACCIIAAQLPGRGTEAIAIEWRIVHYEDMTRSLLGQSLAPDPGVPKRNA